MAKRWKLLLGLAVIVALGAAAVRAVSGRLQERRVISAARAGADQALTAAEAAIDGLSFGGDTRGLLPSHIADLEESRRALAESLEQERKKLRRGYDLASSEDPKQALWAFNGARGSFLSVADSCERLQARADRLRQRGGQAEEQIDLATRERTAARRNLDEVEQADVGLPQNARLEIGESRRLLGAGEAKLASAKALMALPGTPDSVAAYDLAEKACDLFDEARGRVEQKRRLAIEYRMVRLGEARKKQQEFEEVVKEAEEPLMRLKSLLPDESWLIAEGHTERARKRAADAAGLIDESRRQFDDQNFQAATELLAEASDVLDEATTLAEQPGNVYQQELLDDADR